MVGATLILRNIARSDGTVSTAVPAIAVQDNSEIVVAFIPKRTCYKNNWHVPKTSRAASVANVTPSGKRRYLELEFQAPSIRLYLPGFSYSVGLSFDEAGTFSGWYGNLEAPFIRTKLGLDTRDYALDVVADTVGTWRWKDEGEFQRRLELGIDSLAHPQRIREAGWDFIRRLERHDWPFNLGWQNWRAPRGWRARALPRGWDADLGTHEQLSAHALRP